MELEDLEQRLIPFCCNHYEDNSIAVCDVLQMPGHAGFSYGFSVKTSRSVD